MVLGDWTLTGITTFTTGQPVFLTAPNTTGSLYLNPVPNRVCNGNSSAFSGNVRDNGLRWFDTSCFPVATTGYFGNSSRNVVNGPGLNNWDIGAEKYVLLTARARLQLRLEMFNAWNHTQFQQPDGNAGNGPNFSRISASRPPRLIQLAIKFVM